MLKNRMVPGDDDQNLGGSPDDDKTVESTSTDDGQKNFEKLYKDLEKTSKASYAGLQKTLGKVQRDYEQLQGTHTTVSEQFSELQKTHTQTQTAFDALTQRLDAEAPELEELRKFKMRTTVLHEKFPGLVTFEADGLLPTGDTPEELETKFGAFKDKLGLLGEIAEKQAREGGTPPAPDDEETPPSSADEFLKQAMAASASGNFGEFDKLFEQYLKAGGEKPAVIP